MSKGITCLCWLIGILLVLFIPIWHYEENQVIHNLDIWECIEEGSLGIVPSNVIMPELTNLEGIGAWFIGFDFIVS